MAQDMDNELIRFRIDPQVREKAAKACADAGLTLSDVLRAFVTKLAQEGRVPPAAREAAPAPSTKVPPPFSQYNENLWSGLRPRLDAELALSMLGAFIADCTTRIFDEEDGGDSDRSSLAQLKEARDTATGVRNSLDVTDVEAVKKVIRTYGPLLRGEEG